MTLRFAPLPVALPPGCSGVRVDVAEVAPLVAVMPSGDWPESMRGAADSRRADYLAGRLAAREAVRLATSLDARIGRADDGSPVWPDGVEGSISHYRGVAAAVAREARGGIGIDIAPLLDGDRLQAVVRRCLTDAERSRQPSDAEVSLAFAAKEALFKAVHARVQRHVGFDEAEVVVTDGPGSTVDMGHPVDVSDRRTQTGTWTAVLADDLARQFSIATVHGTYAWEHGLVYAVVALD